MAENDVKQEGPAKEPTPAPAGAPRQRCVKRSYLESIGRLPPPSVDRSAIVRAIATEVVSATINGKPHRCSVLELVLQQLRAMALKGDNNAVKELYRLLDKYQPRAENQECGFLIVPAGMSNEEFKEYLKKHGNKERPKPYLGESGSASNARPLRDP